MEQVSSQQKVIKPSLVEIDGDKLILSFSSKSHSFKLSELSPRLASASSSALHHFVISPSGYGIHWPEIDEDISIQALIKTIE